MSLAVKILLSLIAIGLGINGYFAYTQKESIKVVSLDEAIVMRTNGGLLEVATINATESFDKANEHHLFTVKIGKTVARIRVPATYRYHLKLAEEWRFIRRDNVFVVIAPPVAPSLPVAIDTTRLEAEASGAWSIITGNHLVSELQASITPALEERAKSDKYLKLQRDHARKTVAEFVQKWVLSQEKWKMIVGPEIRVFFADEPIQEIQAKGFYPAPAPATR